MKREDKYPSNKWFQYYQKNPSNRFTGDCVIRAISTALELEWDDVFDGLYLIAKKYHYAMNDEKCFKKYLKSKHCVLIGCPKKPDGTRYTGREFVERIAVKNANYIMNIGTHHIVAVKNRKVYDIWDSSRDKVGKVWVCPTII